MTPKAVSFLISVVALFALLFGFVVFGGADTSRTEDDPWSFVPPRTLPVDHAAFFDGPFESAESVTDACLGCHADAAHEVMRTSHWTWAGETVTDPSTGETLAAGKRNLTNNFCIGIAANWARCTSCHVGYGYRDDSFFDTATPRQVDCLVCHDHSGQYEKAPTSAGYPSDSVDLLASARSVGRTQRTNCGTCHFKGGGGDGVKHGDLDETMAYPSARVDVHMGKHGLECADCHHASEHRIRGRLLPPAREPETRVTCTDCHAAAPHAQDRLNAHVATLACQTCHIPQFAVDTGTKMWWDWSQAGLEGDPAEIADRLADEIRGDPERAALLPDSVRALFERLGMDPDLHTHYDRKKGLFLVARRQVPEYRWYDRTTLRYLPGQRIADTEVVRINDPQGDADDPEARIWPFKIHRGRQPFDLEHRHLLVPHLYGPGGYWKTFDWTQALERGAAASGIPFSGRLGWRETEMYWPQNHMVQAKEHSLGCADCHGPGGRMDWEALGYPGDPAFQGDRRQMDLVRERAR